MLNRYFQTIIIFISSYNLTAQDQSLSLNSGNFVSIAGVLQPQNEMTIECWVKPTATSYIDWQPIVHWFKLGGPEAESGFTIMYFENKWRFIVSVGTGNYDIYGDGLQAFPGTELETDVWTHIAGTYNLTNGKARIYKNGVEQESFDTEGGAINWDFIDSEIMKIGKSTNNAGAEDGFFEGLVDEVRLWEYEMSSEEILNVYCDSQPGPDDLIGHWNFNDGPDTAIDDLSGNSNDGFLWGSLDNFSTDEVYDNNDLCPATTDCFDKSITLDDFPLLHDVIDFEGLEQNRLYNLTEIPFENSAAGGQDYTYKLTLLDSANIYFTTCDAQTYLDVEIAILSECDINSATLYNDDAFGNAIWYYPDPTNNINYDFGCTSGIVGNEGYANMIPIWPLPPGEHYFVICNRNGAPPPGEDPWEITSSFGIALTVDSLTTSDDYSEINYFFSEGVYGGEYEEVYNGNGITLGSDDFNLSINPNGGAADEVFIQTLTTVANGTLFPGSEDVKLHLEYPDTPSGSEIVTIKPASEKSIFNSVGVPLLDLYGTTIELIDAQPPSLDSSSPIMNAQNVGTVSNIILTFSEQVRHSDNSNITNANASDCFLLENLETGESIDFTLSTSDNITFTINPDGQLPEYSLIGLVIQPVVEDFNDNSYPISTYILIFRTADETPPTIQSSSIGSINEYVKLTFNEPIYGEIANYSWPNFTYLGQFDGSKYYLSDYSDTWGGAYSFTQSDDDVQLVCISSQEENDFISSSIGFNEAWIGLNDINEEGVYEWVNGEQFSYSNWADGEPNDAGGIENFIHMWGDGTWNDHEATYEIPFVIEAKAVYPIQISNIAYDYSPNGGNCQTLDITGITDQNGSALVGGETVIHVQLELGGSPSGVETVTFSPVDGSSIFDIFGNAMLSSVESQEVTLLASAYIESYALADSNEYVDLTYSVGIYGNSIQSQPVSLASFTTSINSNGGNAVTVTPSGVSKIDNNVLSGGETVLRLYLEYNDLPSGEEKIVISPTTNFSIYSLSGIPVPIIEVSDSIQLNDQYPPNGTDSMEDGTLEVDKEEPITIDFSESIHIPETGLQATVADLIPFITLKFDDSTGPDIPFTLGLQGQPPTITIVPAAPYPSESVIYYSFEAVLQDPSGNDIQINTGATFTIKDYIPPTVSSFNLDSSNSFIDLFFDDQIFGNDNATGTLNISDINVIIISNGSPVDTCIVTSLTKTDSNFLIGGENSIRVNLEFNYTPSGNEFIILKPAENMTVYDESSNQFIADIFTDTLKLFDILPPSIDSISVPIDSFVVLMESTPITFSFNEQVDSLEFTVTSSAIDSVSFDSTRFDSSINITLRPPFASYDSITVNFSYLEDQNELTTVDIAYTYVTPILGDYDLDSSINYNDLWDLVENWEQKNTNYELGPVTGTVPHFISFPDSKFDIEDGMAFVQMWSWYQKTFGEIIEDTSQVGRKLEMTQYGDQLVIFLNDSVTAGQVQFVYDPSNKAPVEFFATRTKENEMYLKYHLPEKGFSILEFARSGSLELDTINFDLDVNNEIELFYSFNNLNNSIYQKGFVQINNNIIPERIDLYPAYPNPFNPVTTLRFDIPKAKTVNNILISIFDIQGREIESLINEHRLPGSYTVQWHANRFSSGMYFARLTYGEKIKTQKIILLK